jgi:hypothetical protein
MIAEPPFAPIVVLLFLGAIAAGMVASAAFVYGAVRHLPVVRRWAGIALLVIPAGYATLLLGASLGSRDRVLPTGARKYFCEIDCHLACSVERVERTKSLGAERAAGTFTVVTLKTWFDESTISPQRSREAPLYPNPREVFIADASGRRFPLSAPESMPLSRPLIPGQSYMTRLVFDLPDDIQAPRLFVGDADPISSLLIGHEQSPLHRKIWFGI